MSSEFYLVGRVRRAHGIRGELVVESLTDEPDAVFASGRRLFAGTIDGDPSPDGATLTVAASKPFKGGVIVRFAEIADRNRAELWRGRYLLAPLSELTPPAEGEVYVHQLVGLRAELPSGDELGPVLGTYELPQGLVLEVDRPGGSVLIPFRDDVVVRLDVAGGVVVVDPPDGLLD